MHSHGVLKFPCKDRCVEKQGRRCATRPSVAACCVAGAAGIDPTSLGRMLDG